MVSKPVNIPGIATVKATEIAPPPTWALLERKLMSLMEQAAYLVIEKYTEKGGVPYYADDVDDLYELFFNWSLFYAIGGDEKIYDLALQEWNAVTRYCDDRNEPDTGKRHIRKKTTPVTKQIHNEYYNKNAVLYTKTKASGAEWHHMSEGNQAFYNLGLGDPTISENVRRAKRFAAMYMDEDPEAPNYDPKYKLIKSPMQSSQGPYWEANLEQVKAFLHGGKGEGAEWKPKPMGTRASLYGAVKDLEMGWWDNPRRAKEVIDLFNKVVMMGDSPNNLTVTSLLSTAYLYTGDNRYKQWVLDYVQVWMDRIKQNKGIIPDNVGLTGKIGEYREGVWWGSLYGWNHYQGFNVIFHGISCAAENAVMLSGDYGYLELLRSQIKVMLDAGIKKDGQLLVPWRYGKDGWDLKGDRDLSQVGPTPYRMQELAHLYHASMSPQDYELIDYVRSNDKMRDWNDVGDIPHEKNYGETELARFNYYDGKNPDWPVKILSQDYHEALKGYDKALNDNRSVDELIAANYAPQMVVFTKGLTQVTMGSPQTVYNGGILRAQVRYFDADKSRPGLPSDVSAFVDELKPDRTGIQLVNLSRGETRNVIVQAGAFGEHSFTEVRVREKGKDGVTAFPVHGKYFQVQLPPSTSIRVEAGMKRFCNTPSFAFPWHGEKIPVPFQ